MAAIVQGCKENTILNSKISPAGNQVGVYSVSLPCITHTYYDDSTITSTNIGGLAVYQGVGVYNDPFFGTMTGSTYFQVIPTDFGPAILAAADSNVIDSAVLILPYSGFTYGDTVNESTTQTYQAFYMLDTMGLNSIYYNYSTKPIDINHPLSDPTTINVYHLRDSVGLHPNVLPQNYPGLRIKLKLPAITKLLLNAQAATTSTNPSQDFLNNFNGICVRVADSRHSATAIPYFQLDGSSIYSQAGILVYYHVSNVVGDTGLIEPYYFNTGCCAHFNNITKSFNHSPVNALLHSTAANDSIIALQNQPGASFDVVVPGIKSLPKGVINKAELRFSVLSYSNPNGALLPERLYPLGIGNGIYPTGISEGLAYTLSDRYPLTSVTPLIVMDGYLHPVSYTDSITHTTTTIQTFTMDLPREVINSIAAGNDVLHLHINGTEDFYGAFHLVAAGGSYGNSNTNDTLYRPKLFVVYSKL